MSTRSESAHIERVDLDPGEGLWDRFFMPAPLVVIGTLEPDGTYDLAPKTMVSPLGWDPYLGFVCTPDHGTYRNIKEQGFFTVSFPAPDQIVQASLTAAPRSHGVKFIVDDLQTEPALHGDGIVLKDAPIVLECKLHSIVDGFGRNSLIAGAIVGARVRRDMIRISDGDDDQVLASGPVLVYLNPGMFAVVDRGFSFPLPAGFSR